MIDAGVYIYIYIYIYIYLFVHIYRHTFVCKLFFFESFTRVFASVCLFFEVGFADP